jgi:hypothetical protein
LPVTVNDFSSWKLKLPDRHGARLDAMRPFSTIVEQGCWIKHANRWSLLRRSVKGLHGNLSEVVVFEVSVWSATSAKSGEETGRGPFPERTRSGCEILDLSLSPFA